MKWNDGRERALFEKEQAQKRKEYLAAGMSEEQIQALRNYDEEWYKSRRREAQHTQRLNLMAFDESNDSGEAFNPLFKKFLHSCSVEDNHSYNACFEWVEQIEAQGLYKAISSLSSSDKKILTLLICDGLNQTEIAEQLGVSQQSISKKIKKFQIIFSKWL